MKLNYENDKPLNNEFVTLIDLNNNFLVIY